MSTSMLRHFNGRMFFFSLEAHKTHIAIVYTIQMFSFRRNG